MAKRIQTVEKKRRIPVQSRAAATVAAIFEATAQLLDDAGSQRLTTNAIAERAGVSIGTLYQYFRDLDHLLRSLAEREMRQVAERVLEIAGAPAPIGAEARIRQTVRALVGAFGGRQRARKRLLQALLARGQGDPLIDTMRATANAFVGRQLNDEEAGSIALSPISGFVLTRAVMGVIRAAVFEEAAIMKSTAFEDELVRLALGYVASHSRATVGAR